MKGLNYTILFLTVSLILGILVAPLINFSISIILGAFAICLLALFAFHALFNIKRKKTYVFTFIAILSFIIIGILNVKLKDPLEKTDHYSHSTYNSEEDEILLNIREVLKPTLYAEKYVADVMQLNGRPASGKVLLNIDKDSTSSYSKLKVDETFYLKTNLSEIARPKNPYQFDYSEYLKRQGIFNQIYSERSKLLLIERDTKTIFGFAANIRSFIQNKLKPYNFSKDEWAVMNALLLGQKQEISKELNDNYAAAGMLHILAVSGLHVGIFMFIIQLLLKPLGKTKRVRILRTLIVISAIWLFALIAGLSPSILRAATMFSFIQVGLAFNHKNGGYNALIFSAFILLLFNPRLIYEVGFQLSYMAVFFIIWLQPSLFKLWEPKSYILKLFWGVFTVSLIAQLGVLPLSLYYFHQFPGLFLISNLVVIPFLGIILGFGIVILLLASLGILPAILADIFGSTISVLNSFINTVASYENLVFKNIYFSFSIMLVAYLIIVTIGLILKRYSFSRLVSILLAILIFTSVLIWEKRENSSNTLLIFHKNRNSLIAEKHNTNLTILQRDSLFKPLKDSRITNLIESVNIEEIKSNNLTNYIQFSEKNILILDSIGIYNIPDLKPDFILLTESPKVNLDRLINTFPQATIIADGSNYKSYVMRWKETCAKNRIPFHSTYEKGFYKIE